MDDGDFTEATALLGELELLPKPCRVAPLTAEFVRDLTAADHEALLINPSTRPATSLARIHASHHALARCIASGMRVYQAALTTGYSEARISILQRDSTFMALVAEYREESKGLFADMAERMSNVSLDALEVLHERLQENPTGFSIPVLLDIVRTFADRTGYGPGGELKVSMVHDTIDRPPREDYNAWKKRREAELVEDSMGTTAWPSNGGNNGRLVS